MGVKNSKLKPETIADLRDATSFTEAELQSWYKGFLKDCPGGKLSVSEFERLYTSFFPQGDASGFAAHAYRTFDSNRDGSIDFREFIIAISVSARGTSDEKLKWAFSLYDIDSDGYITREEMTEILKSIYIMVGDSSNLPDPNSSPEALADKIFKQLDKNIDGKISQEEFIEGAKMDVSIVQLLNFSLQAGI